MDLGNTRRDLIGIAVTAHDDGAVLLALDLIGSSEIGELCVLKCKADFLADDLAACEDCDITQHLFTAVTVSGRLGCTAYERAAKPVDYDVRKSIALDIFRYDHKLPACLYYLLKQRKYLLNGTDLLICNEDERVLEDCLHLFSVGHEIGADVTVAELHSLNDLRVCLSGLALFDGDDAVVGHLLHSIGDHITYGLVSCRNGGYPCDILGAAH